MQRDPAPTAHPLAAGAILARVNLALFDFDGTLTDRDSFSAFVRFAVRPSRMAVGCALVGPMVLAYRLGAVSATRTRAAVARVAFAGQRVDRLRELGERFATHFFPGTIRPAAIERLEWHRRQGDEIVIVSASLDTYLVPCCDAMRVGCICTQLEERNGRSSGRFVGGDCTGPEKARRVIDRFQLSRYPTIYAYGDTEEDFDMLALAHQRFYRWQEVTEEISAS